MKRVSRIDIGSQLPGFSLVEILIGLLIGSIVILSVLTIMNILNKFNKRYYDRLNASMELLLLSNQLEKDCYHAMDAYKISDHELKLVLDQDEIVYLFEEERIVRSNSNSSGVFSNKVLGWDITNFESEKIIDFSLLVNQDTIPLLIVVEKYNRKLFNENQN